MPVTVCMCVRVLRVCVLRFRVYKNETHLSSPQIRHLGVTAIDLEGGSCICASLQKLKGLIKQQGLVQCHFSCASEMNGEEGGSKTE